MRDRAVRRIGLVFPHLRNVCSRPSSRHRVTIVPNESVSTSAGGWMTSALAHLECVVGAVAAERPDRFGAAETEVQAIMVVQVFRRLGHAPAGQIVRRGKRLYGRSR